MTEAEVTSVDEEEDVVEIVEDPSDVSVAEENM